MGSGQSSAAARGPAGPPGPEAGPLRCPTCRTKIVVADAQGWVVRNAILRVSGQTGRATAKCPRCKGWVEVPLTYRS